MHTGFISFCDRVCNNIKSFDTKDIILNDMQSRFNVQILTRHWHRLDDKGMIHVRRVPHFACLRSNGNPYFLFISRYEDIPIIYFVDKKVQPGYQKPRIILGRGKWDESLADGTVIDGEMVKDKNSKWIFLMNDIMAYQGRQLTNEPLPDRLNILRNMLGTQYIADATLDVCTYEVKRYSYATQQGVQALIEMSTELPYTNRGIYFWPFSNKYKPKLHNFDDTLIKSVSVKIKDDPLFRMDVPQEQRKTDPVSPSIPSTFPSSYNAILNAPPAPVQAPCIASSPESPSPVRDLNSPQVLWLRKTEHSDVYDVHPTDNGMLHGNKLGIAYIKTLEDSKYIRDIFLTATVAVYIPFYCTLENNKWKPLRKAD